ncbi:MAG: trypsin-like peptidase domain-containing protein [Crocinitomicaceae bacterium]|nr:trypsin-like peptidase domain-containing protein [Crocinitomicaceae bacterium]
MANNIKLFGIGLLGGMVPLLVFSLFSSDPAIDQTDTYTNDSGISYAQNASFSGFPNTPPENFVAASESSLNSVVHVTTTMKSSANQRDIFSEFFYGPDSGGGAGQYGEASGSGVIVTTDGYIVTNNHVIEDATQIEVTLNDNRKYTAEVIGTDPSTDIAVLKISETGLSAIAIGNSDDLRVGEWVLAVGNPFSLTSTVTAGIVSAKARNINIISDPSNRDFVPIESFIQTDAAVNPGNSGGALVNTNGELVGINTAIASETGSYSGYSFAVPVNLVKKVMTDLIDYGIVQRGFLGVSIANITQELKEEKDLPNTMGVYVARIIADGGAEIAGLEAGDVILKVGTKSVNSVAALQEEVGKRRPGDKLAVTIRNKGGYEAVKEIVLRNRNGDTEIITKDVTERKYALGATFRELTSKEMEELNISYGVMIESIGAGKLKALGLTEGMIITGINNQPVKSIEQLIDKLNSKNSKGVLLEILTESGRKDYVGFGL